MKTKKISLSFTPSLKVQRRCIHGLLLPILKEIRPQSIQFAPKIESPLYPSSPFLALFMDLVFRFNDLRAGNSACGSEVCLDRHWEKGIEHGEYC